jgi:hypothetical protein
MEKKCSKCMGSGWWPVGGLVPIGPMDAREWTRDIIQCPWCGVGAIKNGPRYKALLDIKENEEKGGKNAKK